MNTTLTTGQYKQADNEAVQADLIELLADLEASEEMAMNNHSAILKQCKQANIDSRYCTELANEQALIEKYSAMIRIIKKEV
ncbi:hypothetical protein [Psychromonas sp. Urea-02u-13]|uniref:hypothetical protein n=1 Tax=Psychromonas sp. Urea-02u-13 TaxID=2058326 RepID=UPI000C3385AE|nr:hypothetical protein [Psychromonas sp. Urea-02u-13]PKG37492.1 hypothetical protein CXF74_18640 [Psychromonas sp. Urea-02u-13]